MGCGRRRSGTKSEGPEGSRRRAQACLRAMPQRLAAAAGAGEFPAGRDPAPGEPAGATGSPEGHRGNARPSIDAYVQAARSIQPDRIGHILPSIGVDDWASHADRSRSVPRGRTAGELHEITNRRNRIARTADSNGRRREAIEPEEVARHLQGASAIVEAPAGAAQRTLPFAGPPGACRHMTAGPAVPVDRAPAPPKPGPLLPPHRSSHRTHKRRPDRWATDARFHLGDGAHW